MAETPSPTLIGVQRVVIACDAEGLSESQRTNLCDQLVKKASVVTDLPVAIASAADLDPTELARQSQQLLLRVSASATPVDDTRKTVLLTVTPVRRAVHVAELGPMNSSVGFVKVRDAWMIQGPVDAFTRLLGGVPRKLQRPIRSDS
jgi:hypothetical protein